MMAKSCIKLSQEKSKLCRLLNGVPNKNVIFGSMIKAQTKIFKAVISQQNVDLGDLILEYGYIIKKTDHVNTQIYFQKIVKKYQKTEKLNAVLIDKFSNLKILLAYLTLEVFINLNGSKYFFFLFYVISQIIIWYHILKTFFNTKYL